MQSTDRFHITFINYYQLIYISIDYYQLSIDNNKFYNDDIHMDPSFKKQNEF